MCLKRIILIALIIALSVNIMVVSASGDDMLDAVKFDEDTLEKIQTKYGVTFDSSNITVSNVGTGLYPLTGRMTINAPTYNDDGSIKKTGESNVRINWATKQDMSEYSYINILIYSPAVTSSKLALGAYYDGNTSIQKYNTDGGILIDFAGWKLLSLPMNNFGGMNWDKLTRLRFSTNVYHKPGESDYAWMAKTYLNFDRIWFSKEQVTYPKAQSFYPAQGSRVSALKPQIRIAFNNKLSTVTDGMLSLLKDNEECSAIFDISTDENVVSIVIDADLLADTQYSLKLSGIKDEFNQVMEEDFFYTFTTYAHDVAASEIMAKNSADEEIDVFPENGNMKLSADVKNMGTEDVNPVIYAISYDENGKQKEVYIGQGAENPLQAGEQDSIILEIPADKVAAASNIRAFVSEKKDTISMVGNRFRSFTSSFAPSGALTKNKAEVEVLPVSDEPKIEDGIITLSGRVNVPLGNVLIKITDSNGAVKQLTPVSTDEDGKFGYGFPIDFTSGWYSYTVQYNNASTQPRDFYYISDSERDSITVRINASSDSKGVEGILREYPYEFELGSYSTEEISDLAVYIYEKTPYSLYSEVKSRATLYGSTVKKLRECIWSDLDAVLLNNNDNIFSDKTDYVYYSGLDEAERAKICEKLEDSIPIETIVKFRTDFHTATEEYKSENTPSAEEGNQNTGTERPSGGGGGGGGGKPYRVDTELVQNPELAEDKISADNKEEDKKVQFYDMDTALWAQKAVESLAEAGIISPSPDNKFRPGDAVSREEFLKMTVCVFDLKTDGIKAEFTDVAEDAWYVPYIAAAVKDNIVFGRDDGSFGIGAPITRQDMAVMLYRALSGRGYINLKAEENSFSDGDEISDYARQAVEGLAQNNFIEGNDNNKFIPHGFLTRAEAAQVIYRVHSVIERGRVNAEQN